MHNEVIDKCYSSCMRRKVREGVNIDAGRFVENRRSQEAVDRLMKMMVSNVGADQVNVVGGSKRSTRSRISFAFDDKDGHFSRGWSFQQRQEVCCTGRKICFSCHKRSISAEARGVLHGNVAILEVLVSPGCAARR